MTKGSTDAEKAKWRKLRSRPKKLTPDELHQRAVARRDAKRQMEKIGLEMAKAAKQGDKDRRALARQKLRKAYLAGLERSRVLGIDPVYWHSAGAGRVKRGSIFHRQWLAEAKAWDVRNQPKPETEAA